MISTYPEGKKRKSRRMFKVEGECHAAVTVQCPSYQKAHFRNNMETDFQNVWQFK